MPDYRSSYIFTAVGVFVDKRMTKLPREKQAQGYPIVTVVLVMIVNGGVHLKTQISQS